MLRVSGLSCGRHGQPLMTAVDFELGPGEVVQLEGENGSGKTTLLRALAGLAPALQGRIDWHGRDIRRSAEAYRVAMLYIGHHNGIEPELTAAENLSVLVALDGEQAGRARLQHAVDNVGIGRTWERPAKTMSQGQKRRLALARLWCTTKPLWLLDEPLAALDSEAAQRLATRLDAHRRDGGMAVIATHQPLPQTAPHARLTLTAA